MRKAIKRIITILLILFFCICSAAIVYMEKGANVFMTKANKIELEELIKKSPLLPDKFYFTYEKVHPKALKRGQWSRISGDILFANEKQSLYQQAANVSYYSFDFNEELQKIIGSNTAIELIAFQIEDNCSQKECLNFIANNYDFLYGQIGIEAAANYYFGKKLNDASEREMIELVLMMENPVLYNRKRDRKRLEEEIMKY